MPDYRYTAADHTGAIQTGMVQAVSLQAARDALTGMQLTPQEITEVPTAHTVPVPEQQAPTTPAPPPAPEMPPEQPAESVATTASSTPVYFPLFETLRLYAGWLLAWYSLVYAVGSYQHLKEVPWHIPYAETLFLSPLVLTFTFAAYLFLLCTSVYKAMGKKKGSGLILGVLGIATFVWYRMNVA